MVDKAVFLKIQNVILLNVIGTPGDTEYKGDQLYVNNKKCLNRI